VAAPGSHSRLIKPRKVDISKLLGSRIIRRANRPLKGVTFKTAPKEVYIIMLQEVSDLWKNPNAGVWFRKVGAYTEGSHGIVPESIG